MRRFLRWAWHAATWVLTGACEYAERHRATGREPLGFLWGMESDSNYSCSSGWLL